MSNNDSTLKNKLSSIVKEQLPDFVKSDHDLFADFIQQYYAFLETTKMKISTTAYYLKQEPETTSYILQETNKEESERFVLEEIKQFVNGETITGSTSKATATVVVENAREGHLYVTGDSKFVTDETITGSTSGATSTITELRDNPVRNIQQLLSYADTDNTIYDFLDQIKYSFMNAIPKTLASGVSRRNLVKSIKDLYSAKGTKEGHKLFMRLLLGENSEIVYPNQYMIRMSDGNWKENIKIRVSSTGSSGSEALNKVITGGTSQATATVSDVSTFQQGVISVIEFTIEDYKFGINLDTLSLSGFVSGETITATSVTSDTEISFTIKDIISTTSISNDGILNTANEDLVVDSSKGNGFGSVKVGTLNGGGISEVFVDTVGSGYEAGEKVLFSGGTDIIPAEGFISVIGGGILLESGTDSTGTGTILIESGSVLIDEPFNIALESKEVLNGPFYLYGTAGLTISDGTAQNSAGKRGYFYPIYLTETTAKAADSDSSATEQTFNEFPGITFYMPASTAQRAVDNLTTTAAAYQEYPDSDVDLLLLDRTTSGGADAGFNILMNNTQTSLDLHGTATDKLVLEYDTLSVSEATSINKIILTNFGQGYTSLPTITPITSGGSSAKLIPLTTDIGAVNSLKINDAGFNYNTDDIPDMTFNAHFILKDVTGTFAKDNTLASSGHTGTVVSWDSTNNLLTTTFENVERMFQEFTGTVNLPFVTEELTGTVLSGNDFLLEDTQIIEGTSNDNIILDGTSSSIESTRFVNLTVKVKYSTTYEQNVFEINGIEKPNLQLKEGWTYYFDLSDSSLYNATSTANHQLKFSLTSDGTHGSGTEYTTNVTKSTADIAIGTSGAYIQIVIPEPGGDLYYYCVNHSGMGNIIQTLPRLTIISDENDDLVLDSSFANVSYIQMESASADQPLQRLSLEEGDSVFLEESNASQQEDVGAKVLIDNLVTDETSKFLDETDGQRLKLETFGNHLLLDGTDGSSTDAGSRIVSETDSVTSMSATDFIVIDGTDSSSNNAGSEIIFENLIDFSGNDVVITDSGGATGTVILADISRGSLTVDTTSTSEGNYKGINSLINEDLNRIQDSYYYQQFSYEVQVGQSTTQYINELKQAVHPAGFAVFGKVSIATLISTSLQASGTSVSSPSLDTFSPILASTLDFIFDERIQTRTLVVPVSDRVGHREDTILQEDGVIIGDGLILDGTDGSSSNAGDSIIDETDSRKIILEHGIISFNVDSNGNIVREQFIFESGTKQTSFDDGGGRMMMESSSAPGANNERTLTVENKVTVSSKPNTYANSKNLLVHLGNDPFDETSGFMLEDATFGTLLLDGTDIFGTDAGDNILLNASASSTDEGELLLLEPKENHGVLVLNGIEPLPTVVEIVLDGTDASGTDAGDNVLQEDGLSKILADGSNIFTHGSLIKFHEGEKLMSDEPRNQETFTISQLTTEFNLKISDIIRPSRLLLSQNGDMVARELVDGRIKLEFDDTTYIALESDVGGVSFVGIETGTEDTGLLSPFIESQGDINNALAKDPDAIALEDTGFLTLNGTDSSSTNANSFIVDEDNFRIIQEVDGVLIMEENDTGSNDSKMELEDGNLLLQEKSLNKESIDRVQLEDTTAEIGDVMILDGTDGSSTNAGDDLILDDGSQTADIELLKEGILLEEADIRKDVGQISFENLTLNFNKDGKVLRNPLPLNVIQIGKTPVVRGAYIIKKAS